MHQSPEKMTSRRRDKYGAIDQDDYKSRRAPREAQPKARKALRDEPERDTRWDKESGRR